METHSKTSLSIFSILVSSNNSLVIFPLYNNITNNYLKGISAIKIDIMYIRDG